MGNVSWDQEVVILWQTSCYVWLLEVSYRWWWSVCWGGVARQGGEPSQGGGRRVGPLLKGGWALCSVYVAWNMDRCTVTRSILIFRGSSSDFRPPLGSGKRVWRRRRSLWQVVKVSRRAHLLDWMSVWDLLRQRYPGRQGRQLIGVILGSQVLLPGITPLFDDRIWLKRDPESGGFSSRCERCLC